MCKGAPGVKQGFCGKSVRLRDIEQNWAFWEENGAFEKNECAKGTLW